MTVVAALLAASSWAGAQDDEEAEEGYFDEFAEAIADSMAPRWGGPRVDWPERRPRPVAMGATASSLHPVNVHVGPTAHPDLALAVLDGLEMAHGWLETNGWPTAPPDGGYGGTPGFDLYLMRDAAREGRMIWTSWDTPLLWGGLDAVTSFAVLDADAPPDRAQACAVDAYVQASLLSRDPAEAEAWRVATGTYVAWLLTGHWGCGEAMGAHQQAPSRGWVTDAPDSGEGGGLFLAMLSARTDGLTGDFIRDLWTGAPQLTWEGDRLRAAPDMWQVIYTVMEVGQDPLPQLIEEMSVARFFAGSEARRVGAPMGVVRALPADAEVPLVGTTSWGELPRRYEPNGLELEPFGSAYLLVDTSDAPAGSVLRIWMRGEYGVGWSLIAVRLGADGRERGRVRAPVRPRTPRSYIPLELTDAETERVLVVVTNMGGRLPDADEPEEMLRAFRLILDKSE